MIVVEYVCLLGDLDRQTQVYGSATVLGFASMTGVPDSSAAAKQA